MILHSNRCNGDAFNGISQSRAFVTLVHMAIVTLPLQRESFLIYLNPWTYGLRLNRFSKEGFFKISEIHGEWQFQEFLRHYNRIIAFTCPCGIRTSFAIKAFEVELCIANSWMILWCSVIYWILIEL